MAADEEAPPIVSTGGASVRPAECEPGRRSRTDLICPFVSLPIRRPLRRLMVTTAPDHYARALSFALVAVWNSETDRFRFSNSACRRGGVDFGELEYTCTMAARDRTTGETRAYRFVV